jgi:hypothetical protein
MAGSASLTTCARPPSNDPVAVGVDRDARAVGAGSSIRWLGRVDTSDAGLGSFDWSASGFAASVSGSTISVSLQTRGATTAAFFMPVIDGVAGARFQVLAGPARTVVLGSGLSPGPHSVSVYRESEGAFGDSVFFGFPDGKVGPAPPPSPRYLEIVGDSISAGYANLGTEVHDALSPGVGCGFSLDTESAHASYGAVLARMLGADVSIVARSGWGMVRDFSGSTANVLPAVYGDTLGAEATSRWSFERKADAVVVDLGTNDTALGDPGAPFEDAYVAFLRTVRANYPAAWIFLTIGPMLKEPMLRTMQVHLAKVVGRTADPRIVKIDIPPEDFATTGCHYHPNAAEDATMASALAPTIRTRLGW